MILLYYIDDHYLNDSSIKKGLGVRLLRRVGGVAVDRSVGVADLVPEARDVRVGDHFDPVALHVEAAGEHSVPLEVFWSRREDVFHEVVLRKGTDGQESTYEHFVWQCALDHGYVIGSVEVSGIVMKNLRATPSVKVN